jgi:hypothetical protein
MRGRRKEEALKYSGGRERGPTYTPTTNEHPFSP